MMPYISHKDRVNLAIPKSPGELNYTLTKICHAYIGDQGMRYTTLNEVIGVLECAKLEFYRQIISPYEDVKKELNGPVSELDA